MSKTLDELYAAARSLWTERADLRAAHGSLEFFAYWSLLLSTGMAENPALARLADAVELTGADVDRAAQSNWQDHVVLRR
ncbi:MAG: hypothetical protein FJ299_08225 [Planctomycetes bacterium]|nr:hypothetical protein [Planctomycetota bacterium]